MSAVLRQFDSKAQPAPQGQLLADAVSLTFAVVETFPAWDVRSQAEFTVYKLQVTVKRESGQQTSLELLKRYSQFDDLHEVVRFLALESTGSLTLNVSWRRNSRR